MNYLDDMQLNRSSYSFREIIGQPNEWTPRYKPRAVTVSGNVNPLDFMLRVDATAGAVTLTLETAVGCDGRIHRFKKIDSSSNAMTVDGAGSETLDGAANQSTTVQYGVITAVSNGVGWDLLLGSGGGSSFYEVPFWTDAALTASLPVHRLIFTRTVVFAAGLAPSKGIARIAATATTTFLIQKNLATVGNIQWAAAGTVASFIMASETTYTAGDVMDVFAPEYPDASLQEIVVNLAGTPS